ncbi:hypothetical protein [Siphonobacter sp. SORGH_AS_0500]|uniref:hypothetical protein n=1 Tax=Siphonobacter sp. SORGH_AS_0500 TaxID=1864824 RepID=UPI00286D1C14|nr:hypothetical protein [Siphonobacter sp. SORGH_AS_0500]
MVLIQSLSQNIPIAVLEAVAIMTLVAGIGWILGRRSMNHQIDTIQMEIATKQVELEMCRQGKPKPFRQDKTTKPFHARAFCGAATRLCHSFGTRSNQRTDHRDTSGYCYF